MGAALTAAALIAGCGSQYRSVVTPINPSGPASQPESWAVVVSAPSTTTNGVTTALPGVATIIDYSGDSVMAWNYLLGTGPTSLTVDGTGSTGYTINSDHTMTSFPVSDTFQYKNEDYLTLPSGAEPVNLFSPSSALWIADRATGAIDIETGSPQSFVDAVPVGNTPIMMIGPSSSGSRNYAVSQNITSVSGLECNASPTAQPLGQVTGIEVSSTGYSLDAAIPVGQCPVYAVESSDGQRLFVINRGSDTVSVINVKKDTLDTCTPFTNPENGETVTCHPTLPLSLGAVKTTGITPFNGTTGMTQSAGPVYAEYNTTNQQLIVADYDGGTISVIDVPLDEWGNDYNTYDSNGNITSGFGKTHTVKVGNNPASVTVLVDGSRAYTANQTDSTVSIVNLSSYTKEKADLGVVGHPRTVVSTQNSLYGKVYVASPDSNVVTIISTVDDIVDTTQTVTGNVVDVRVSTQNAVSGNNNNVSRVPGFGQPCNLPISDFDPTASGATLTGCQAQVATTSTTTATKK
jgi:DNA-binding beta-propeller fold protein YncE